MFVHRLAPEHDLGHVDAVLRPALLGDGAEMGLVAQRHMGVEHVEMALAHRHVAGLADHEAAVVQVGVHVNELHQVLETLDISVAPAAFEIAHERRAVDCGKDLVRTADFDRTIRVARKLGELPRRFRTKIADPVRRAAYHVVLDRGAGFPP